MPEESNQKNVHRHSGLYVKKQVLILNITRLGDVIQTVPLIHRLHHEWPGVAIDLVVDQQLAGMAELLPGVRRVISRDFRDLRSLAPTSPALPRELIEWAHDLAATGYDRVINLTFTPQSGRLASLFQASDTRGVTMGVGNTPIVKNPWLAHVVDLHHFRSFNRFNIADLYALGGSGAGPSVPIQLSVPHNAEQWTNEFLGAKADHTNLVAVHAGASNAIKAWRPEHFGRTMAALSQQTAITFVLIGTGADRESATQVMQAYRAVGGTVTVLDAIGQTTIPQLAALLARCRLALSGDSGPMHLAGGVGTPAQELLIVVPQDHPVEVEAQVENKDVGFVKAGQVVEVKVETFTFTLYGTIPGRVLSISNDAAPIEKVGLVYPTRVSMDRATIQVEGKHVYLSPGMAVTVEIKTGQRRVIEYLLSPLLKSVQESLRER